MNQYFVNFHVFQIFVILQMSKSTDILTFGQKVTNFFKAHLFALNFLLSIALEKHEKYALAGMWKFIYLALVLYSGERLRSMDEPKFF